MIGNETAICARTARWSATTPICERIQCFPKSMKMNGGQVTCTNSNFAFSQCRTECHESRGFVMSGEATKTCNANGTWSREEACCSRPCPPYAILDIILIFDSSSSVGLENWKKLMDFCAEIVGSFTIDLELMRVGAFRYNKIVDTTTEVLLGEVGNFAELRSKVHKIPYNGSGTKTGNALMHAYNYSLNTPGNRPNVRDVVLLFTDGVSHDDVATPARLLRQRGADVNVVGIKNIMGRLNVEQMRSIVSEPIQEHITIISGGFKELTSAFVRRISKLVCGNPCKHLIS
uniref:VWFA domain-containing protein n=1 Tax=Ciona savignyi TaxID=51511 RepID=H2ZHL1_CIOSA